MDGIDFRIQEPTPFNPRWWTHKFNGAGLRYEIAICIQTGECVWINGPIAPCYWTDDKIAKEKGLWDCLGPGEKFLADGVYTGWRAETPTGHNNYDQYMKAVARARHETFNGRLKRFGVLTQKFRHGVEKHGPVTHAIAFTIGHPYA